VFLGHLAVGFAAKRAAPEASLGILLGASELIDLLFPAFVLAGWEQVRIDPGTNPFLVASYYYPFSHSLAATLVWAILAALLYWLVTRYRTGALVAGLVVVSHWLLDVASHKPDMPLYPGPSPLIGLGLWYSVAGTVIVEGLMFAAGVWIYTAATRAKDRKGIYGFWTFVALMVFIYASSVAAPSPPNPKAIAWVGLTFGLFFLWAHWFDRHRELISTHES
jgi:hypothetical protein